MSYKIIMILFGAIILNIQLFTFSKTSSEESKESQKPCLVCVTDIDGDSWQDDNLLCNTKCRTRCTEGRTTFTFQIDKVDNPEDTQKPCLVCDVNVDGESWYDDNLLCNTKCRKRCMEGRVTFSFEINSDDDEGFDDDFYDE